VDLSFTITLSEQTSKCETKWKLQSSIVFSLTGRANKQIKHTHWKA
jgi:hypothetical protein